MVPDKITDTIRSFRHEAGSRLGRNKRGVLRFHNCKRAFDWWASISAYTRIGGTFPQCSGAGASRRRSTNPESDRL